MQSTRLSKTKSTLEPPLSYCLNYLYVFLQLFRERLPPADRVAVGHEPRDLLRLALGHLVSVGQAELPDILVQFGPDWRMLLLFVVIVVVGQRGDAGVRVEEGGVLPVRHGPIEEVGPRVTTENGEA